MTVEQIQEIRKNILPEDAVIVRLDNEHHLFDQTKGKPNLIWDDDFELITSVEPTSTNFDTYSQNVCPLTVRQIPYDMVQDIYILKALPSAAEFVKNIKGTVTETEGKKMDELLSSIATKGRMVVK